VDQSSEDPPNRWFLDGTCANEKASADSGLPFAQIGFTQVGDAVLVEDLGSSVDVFLRLDQPQRLKTGDLILIGSQRFRFERVAAAETAPESGANPHPPEPGASAPSAPTQPLATGRLVLLDSAGKEAGFPLLPGSETIVGRKEGYSFPEDDRMSDVHARISTRGKEFIVQDQASATGTFLQMRKRALLRNGDMLLIGERLWKIVDQEVP
jgi:pSer/pThr/pTyr-binding forkhead associated (FHA) protein